VTLLPKPVRERNEAFLDLVRSEPCAGCGAPPPSDPNHLKTRGAGGSDYETAPMCRVCHTEWHAIGPRTWAEKRGVNLYQVTARLLVKFFTR